MSKTALTYASDRHSSVYRSAVSSLREQATSKKETLKIGGFCCDSRKTGVDKRFLHGKSYEA